MPAPSSINRRPPSTARKARRQAVAWPMARLLTPSGRGARPEDRWVVARSSLYGECRLVPECSADGSQHDRRPVRLQGRRGLRLTPGVSGVLASRARSRSARLQAKRSGRLGVSNRRPWNPPNGARRLLRELRQGGRGPACLLAAGYWRPRLRRAAVAPSPASSAKRR